MIAPVKIFQLLIVILLLPGCGTIGYYSQLINGHFDLMESEQEISKILEEKHYKEEIRLRLKKALEIRRFATESLGLPDNDSYKTFVKLDRPYPVWNVIAAEKFSISAKQWCFLVVGCVSYRGYFNEADARRKAKELELEGYDVTVSPAAAYSTLGWFDDPLLSSMLYKEVAHLAGIIFHELAHQKVYIDDDSAFNEAFATAVEIEGVKRWLASQNDREGIRKYRIYKQRQKEFNHLLKQTRQRLKRLYQNNAIDEAVKLNRKKEIIQQMKQEYLTLKKQWGGYKGYDKWMDRKINNAHLALVATYHELVPGFEKILRELNFDLIAFYARVEQLGQLTGKSRQAVFAGEQAQVENTPQ